MTFVLHPRLAADTVPVGHLPLCSALLMNDRRFPWLILVPRRPNIREMFELKLEDYAAVMSETKLVSEYFCRLTNADKMNVAALGNAVPQLHIHIIARYENDEAWPAPVWSAKTKAKPYTVKALKDFTAILKKDLNITKM